MPLDKKGNFRMNPQIARLHDSAPAFGHGEPKEKKTPDPGAQHGDGDGKHVELHANHPEADGKPFTTVHHHGDGRAPELKHHDSLHEAHHAINEHMSQDGCKGDGNCEHTAEPANDIGEEEQSSVSSADEY